jgi:hypothetical protein
MGGGEGREQQLLDRIVSSHQARRGEGLGDGACESWQAVQASTVRGKNSSRAERQLGNGMQVWVCAEASHAALGWLIGGACCMGLGGGGWGSGQHQPA